MLLLRNGTDSEMLRDIFKTSAFNISLEPAAN